MVLVTEYIQSGGVSHKHSQIESVKYIGFNIPGGRVMVKSTVSQEIKWGLRVGI